MLDDIVNHDYAEFGSKTPTSKDGYFGVRRDGSLFRAKFSAIHLGKYLLSADAALAYDAYLRASKKTGHFAKINFKTKEEYKAARNRELKGMDREEGADSVETLNIITLKVNEAVSK